MSRTNNCAADCESHPDVVWLRQFAALERQGIKEGGPGGNGVVGLMYFMADWKWYTDQRPLTKNDIVRIPERHELLNSAGVGSVAELEEFLKKPSNMTWFGENLGVRYQTLKRFQSSIQLVEALETLGELLADREQSIELAVIGGGSLLLLNLIERPTKDLDAVAIVRVKKYVPKQSGART